MVPYLSWKFEAQLIEENSFIILCALVLFDPLLCFDWRISKCWPLPFTFLSKMKSYETRTDTLNQRLCSVKVLSRCHGKGLLIRETQMGFLHPNLRPCKLGSPFSWWFLRMPSGFLCRWECMKWMYTDSLSTLHPSRLFQKYQFISSSLIRNTNPTRCTHERKDLVYKILEHVACNITVLVSFCLLTYWRFDLAL